MRLVDIHSLGTQYDVCVRGGHPEKNANFPDTSIAIQMRVALEGWHMVKGFTAFVFFLRPNEGNRPIILATIAGPITR